MLEPAPTWAVAHRQEAEPRWRIVDRALREIAVRRTAVDADEACWLREAEALQIWRLLGMVFALDYLERVLGYAQRSAATASARVGTAWMMTSVVDPTSIPGANAPRGRDQRVFFAEARRHACRALWALRSSTARVEHSPTWA